MDCAQTEWIFYEGELDRDDVHQLLIQHLSFAREVSPPQSCHALAIERLRDPAIRFYSVREDGTLLGIGALKQLSDGHGEVKSMRTADAALGRGVGRAMLNHLLLVAREAGFSKVSLETGSGPPFDAATQLYVSAGFEPCKSFADYPNTDFNRFYSRQI